MIVECSSCPVRGQRCDGCMVTAMAAMPVVGQPETGLPLDAAERRAVRAFVDAGLVSRRQAGSLRARREAGAWRRRESG